MDMNPELPPPPTAGSAFSAFSQDPETYLTQVVSQPPSRQALSQLAGPLSTWFSVQDTSASVQTRPALQALAGLYLEAAGIQLRDGSNLPEQGGRGESDSALLKQLREILASVGTCATVCKSQPAVITRSGILPTLAHLMLNSSQHVSNQLTPMAVEFLQCAVLSQHYRYAARFVAGKWPRPDASSDVELVLRYYYLRGTLHLGCNDYVMAHRCFWACLSVPAEIVSKTMVAAWKKLSLVQCIMCQGTAKVDPSTMIPKSTSNDLRRFIKNSQDAMTTKATAADAAQRHQQQNTQASRKQQQLDKEAVEGKTLVCYFQLVEAFHGRDRAKFEGLLELYEVPILSSDENYGLARKCLTQLIHNQVHDISQIYSVVSFSKVAAILGMGNNQQSEAERQQQVATLLCQSGVPCEIQNDGMIVFGNNPDENNGSTSMVDLAEWMQLLDQVQQLDINIMTSQKYHAVLRKEGNDAKKTPAGPRGVEDV